MEVCGGRGAGGGGGGSLDGLPGTGGIKGKLGEDVGQPGIRAGDTRVSHTHPGTTRDTLVPPARTPGCPTSSPSFPFSICPK